MMTDAQYKVTQSQMLAIGLAVEKINCDDFLERASLADTMGPILDPTLYRDAMNNMQAIQELAKAYQQVQAAMEKLKTSVLQTAIAGKLRPAPKGPRLV